MRACSLILFFEGRFDMSQHQSYEEQRNDFKDFYYSKRWGSETDPDTGRVHYRGGAGPGTVEFSYDPSTHEVVNGIVREKDMCR